nr:hypothetical protein [Candidatus Magasanikbacteria bacterium]
PTQIFDSASTDAVAYADTAEIALSQSDGVVATVAPLPDISGMVFADTNNNNQYDPQIDLTMRGVQIQLSFDSKLIAETMTETDGSYIFARPDAKIYMVEVMVPDGYTTTQKTGMVTPIGSMSAQMPINFMIKPRPTL